LELIDFLKSLDGDGVAREYEALRDGLGRRPTLAEFYRSGANLGRMRNEYESWFGLVKTMGDLAQTESASLGAHSKICCARLETTAMTKSFKMVLLEAFQELDGWHRTPTLDQARGAIVAGSAAPPATPRRSSRHPRRHPRRHEHRLATLLA
jgi:hypothetical protein